MPIASFLAGFLFDLVMLRRIDEFKVILQQAVYLAVSGALIAVELIEQTHPGQPAPAPSTGFFAKAWKYREAVLHFLLGTLLNSYTIFYFKSASALSSFIFIAVLIGLLSINEFVHVGKSQLKVHMAFWSLCLVSYFVSLAPILMGFIGFLPFLSAVAASMAVLWLFCRIVRRRLHERPALIRTHVIFPYASIQAIFVLLYFFHAIPPVPLSVSYMGIYHDIQKSGGGYQLSYTRPWWKFWQNGDQTFLARPGDSIFCFAQIFSPTSFKDQLQIRWLYRDSHGWHSSDAIPMAVVGGREEGYRAITKKGNYQPGHWRVQVETKDSQEIGRIGFTIEEDPSTDARVMKTVTK